MTAVFSPNDIVRSGLCIGCGSCVAQSRLDGSDTKMQFDTTAFISHMGLLSGTRSPQKLSVKLVPFRRLQKKKMNFLC